MSPKLPRHAKRAGLVFAALIAASALGLSSCDAQGPRPASIWTDVPEFALYAELFNASQTRYRVDVSWKGDLAEAVRTWAAIS